MHATSQYMHIATSYKGAYRNIVFTKECCSFDHFHQWKHCMAFHALYSYSTGVKGWLDPPPLHWDPWSNIIVPAWMNGPSGLKVPEWMDPHARSIHPSLLGPLPAWMDGHLSRTWNVLLAIANAWLSSSILPITINPQTRRIIRRNSASVQQVPL